VNKVLLVDDEVLVRNDLHTLIDWEEHGYLICGEATNGTEAIQMIEQYAPHIVIMDMNMPGMDGVSLCKYMQEQHAGIKKIILSSYDKFDYVRETMKNGAVDYLLKHEMDGAALLRILSKARNELTDEAEQVRRWEVISPSVTQNMIRDLILDHKNGMDQIKSVPNFQHSNNIVVAALQIDNFIIFTAQYSDTEKNKLIRSIMELCQRILKELEVGIVSYIDQGRFVIVYFFEEYSHNNIQQQVVDNLYKVRKSMSLYLNIDVFFEHSNVMNNLSNIPESYESICNLLKKRSFSNHGHAVNNELKQEQMVTLSLDHERKLMTAAKLLDKSGAHSILEDVFSHCWERKANDDSIQLIVNELIHIANKVWMKSGLHTEKYYEGDYLSREQIKQHKKLDEILHWLKDLYSQLIQKLSAIDVGGTYSKHVVSAVMYIKLHYKDNISLELVADHIGISSSYLSRLFKEEMNCGFTEYLNRVRIKTAQLYIESGEYQIKEIYEKVGFSSYNYFFKVFKDTTGATPHRYGKTIDSKS